MSTAASDILAAPTAERTNDAPAAVADETRLAAARFAFVPRTVPETFDTALLILRETVTVWGPIYLLAALVGGVSVHVAAEWPNGLPVATLIAFLLISGGLGVFALAAMFPVLFGRPASVGLALRIFAEPRAYVLAVTVCLWRCLIAIGLLTCVFPGVMLAVYQGFRTENRLFRRVHRTGHDRRTQDLVNQHMSDLALRLVAVTLFSVALWGLLALTVDTAMTLLFGVDLYLGRLERIFEFMITSEDFELAAVEWYDLTFHDPWIQTELLATALAAYLVGRVAWFLTYVDLRVRYDCWDMELELITDALRLAGREPVRASGNDTVEETV